MPNDPQITEMSTSAPLERPAADGRATSLLVRLDTYRKLSDAYRNQLRQSEAKREAQIHNVNVYREENARLREALSFIVNEATADTSKYPGRDLATIARVARAALNSEPLKSAGDSEASLEGTPPTPASHP